MLHSANKCKWFLHKRYIRQKLFNLLSNYSEKKYHNSLNDYKTYIYLQKIMFNIMSKILKYYVLFIFIISYFTFSLEIDKTSDLKKEFK